LFFERPSTDNFKPADSGKLNRVSPDLARFEDIFFSSCDADTAVVAPISQPDSSGDAKDRLTYSTES